jgi:diguanylate cyclase (GGDEF)-like protein
VKISTRYMLLGAGVGLLAPVGLFVHAAAIGYTLDPLRLSLTLAVGGMTIFAIVGRLIGHRDDLLVERNRELAALSKRLREISTIDALTEIQNRRSFDERLKMELDRTRRYGVPCALVMIDLDRFKRVNDRHGHLAGDEVLRHVAGLLEAGKRSGDVIARYGGEELAAILPHTEATDAAAWAERARARLEDEPTRFHGAPIVVTASFGVASASPSTEDAARLIEAADYALYAAKRRGGNTVTVASQTLAPIAGGAHTARKEPSTSPVCPGQTELDPRSRPGEAVADHSWELP